jgi:cbb3-type cytochrome c oxidase subunit III
MNSRRAALALIAAASLLAAATARAESAAQVFARSCSPCHGKDGHPSPVFEQQGVKNFTDPAWQKGITDAQIEKAIHEGKKGTMMASFDKQLSAQEIKALVAYLRKLGAPKK